MDERKLRALHRAVQPILQRTAPTAAQTRATITPPVLDQIAWGVVLAYVANVSRPAPKGLPPQARSGEAPLREEDVRSALACLRQEDVQPSLAPEARGSARFATAAGRLLEVYGWAPQRAAQAAGEMADALRSAARA